MSFEMTQIETTQFCKNYRDGYHNGRADRLLRYRSVIAMTSPLPGYRQGYQCGQEREREKEHGY